MSKYIDADVLYRWIQTECNPYGRPTLDYETSVIILCYIAEMPPADVVQHKSGHWLPPVIGKIGCVCSECLSQVDEDYDYCPMCGAMMVEDKTDEVD